jgi:hypothetical protein
MLSTRKDRAGCEHAPDTEHGPSPLGRHSHRGPRRGGLPHPGTTTSSVDKTNGEPATGAHEEDSRKRRQLYRLRTRRRSSVLAPPEVLFL